MRKIIEVTAQQALSQIMSRYQDEDFLQWLAVNADDFKGLAVYGKFIYKLEGYEHTHDQQGQPSAQERQEVRGHKDQGGQQEEEGSGQGGSEEDRLEKERRQEERQARQRVAPAPRVAS